MAELGLYCLTTGRRFELAGEMVSKNEEFVYLDFQLSTIHFLAGQRLAEFSNAFFQNVLQRRSHVHFSKIFPAPLRGEERI